MQVDDAVAAGVRRTSSVRRAACRGGVCSAEAFYPLTRTADDATRQADAAVALVVGVIAVAMVVMACAPRRVSLRLNPNN